MQFHPTKTVLAYLAMSLIQLPLTSACFYPSQPMEAVPSSVRQESNGVTKISSMPATDAWYGVQFVTENDAFLSMPKGLWRSIDGGRNWRLIHLVKDYDETIQNVQFLDTKFGWMKSHNGWFKSEDGGQTWQLFATPLSSTGRLSVVKFINDKTGWIGGGVLRARSKEELKLGAPRYLLDDMTGKVLRPIIYRTDDRGKTWRVQKVPNNLGNIQYLSFLDSDHGIAFSGPSAFYTRNGGTTWIEVNDPETCIGEIYEGKPSWAYSLDASYQWLAFDDGRILRTTNGGQNWIEQQPCDQIRPVVIHFSSQENGQGLDSEGFLYKTTDGGTRWIKVGTEKYAFLNSLDDQHVWLVSAEGLFRTRLDQ